MQNVGFADFCFLGYKCLAISERERERNIWMSYFFSFQSIFLNSSGSQPFSSTRTVPLSLESSKILVEVVDSPPENLASTSRTGGGTRVIQVGIP